MPIPPCIATVSYTHLDCKDSKDRTWRLFLIALALLVCPIGIAWQGFQVSAFQVNIFYQLAFGVFLYSAIERLQQHACSPAILLPAIMAIFFLPEGYGASGIVLFAALILFQNSSHEQGIAIFLWSLCYHLSLFSQLGAVVFLYVLGGSLAAVAVSLYSQKSGPHLGRLFYGIYPLHLLLYTVLGYQLFR